MFLEYADRLGISSVPKPILCNSEKGIAIIEYIDGHKILWGELRKEHVLQALLFFESLNTKPNLCDKERLLPASEACFSIQDHLECVNSRIPRLLQLPLGSEVERSAKAFVRSDLIPLWEKIKASILIQEQNGIIDPNNKILEEEICLSPSDFGFHNAIETPQGRVYFIDFEYAGMDDPVKMIADFFCQPSVPVPLSYLPEFTTRVLGRLQDPENHYRRLQMLFPVHAIKWCCIILNEFLVVGEDRRRFADECLNINEIKESQLNKARTLLSTLETRSKEVSRLLQIEMVPPKMGDYKNPL
ncbi:MAG TPA: hypothetical protein VN372_08515 [Methanospirillum sp.]|nr:hypothetical protein [Methanospirillum sp.]